MIRLVENTIDNKDIDSLIEWLKTYPKLTKGQLTIEFEKQLANWFGSKYAVFVNSGSSANLLMLYALKMSGTMKNKKVVVPSLSWATDLSPVIQLDMEPILVDCNLANLSVDINHLEQLFKEHEPSALLLVSVLGFSPDMESLVELCDKYDVTLLEDNCESQGTKYNGIKLGNFGKMASCSTYFGHIMSTIEGGVITTNDETLYEILIQLRSHGWARDLNDNRKNSLREEYGIDEFSELYTFYLPGFNLRSTDLQAFIGLQQLKKVDEMITRRNENLQYYKQLLSDKVWFPTEVESSYTANFSIPVILETLEQKKRLVELLRQNGVECRPLISGSMGTQPFYTKLYGRVILPNCSIVDERGIYVPNHPDLTKEQIEFICNLILSVRGD
jgi:CDP-6-deoxy-D-xylo-4-hexulose-3-dehydrase